MLQVKHPSGQSHWATSSTPKKADISPYLLTRFERKLKQAVSNELDNNSYGGESLRQLITEAKVQKHHVKILLGDASLFIDTRSNTVFIDEQYIVHFLRKQMKNENSTVGNDNKVIDVETIPYLRIDHMGTDFKHIKIDLS